MSVEDGTRTSHRIRLDATITDAIESLAHVIEDTVHILKRNRLIAADLNRHDDKGIIQKEVEYTVKVIDSAVIN